MLEYFTYKKFKNNRDKKLEERAAKEAAEAQGADEPKSPILNDEEEAFLERITSEVEEETPPPLPERPRAATAPVLDNDTAPPQQTTKGKDAQTALMDGADQIALPQSPPPQSDKKKRNYFGWVPDIPKRAKSMRQPKSTTAPPAPAPAPHNPADLNNDGVVSPAEAAEALQEQQDLTQLLDQLNLAAVNNRVFSFSRESQTLLEKFKLVLRDLITGAPHAYSDLEKLLTNSEDQLDKLFASLPPFLQTLVRSLPAKVTAALAPEVLAAGAAKPDEELKAAGASKYKKYAKHATKLPPLKRLVGEQGAIAAMLRAILNFLKLRFPAVVTGTNVLMSLAVFILLFVFWYCHKRGREVRLAAEGSNSSEEEFEREKIVLTPGAKPEGEPAIVFAEEAGPMPSPRVEGLPSVLDLPEPRTVPLPEGGDEGLEVRTEGKGKGRGL